MGGAGLGGGSGRRQATDGEVQGREERAGGTLNIQDRASKEDAD